MESYLSYLLPFVAVLIGYLIVMLWNPKQLYYSKLLLSFSGAFLLALTVFSLLPQVYSHASGRTVGIGIVSGILLQIILEFFSQGAEHGHIHHPLGHRKQFPWSLFLSLSLHSVLEGFPLHHHHSLVYGIVIHKLPIAIILTLFLIRSGVSFFRTLLFMMIFSLMTPLGAFLSVHCEVLNHYHTEISSVVIGIFLHVSSVILFESSQNHKFNSYKLSAILLGFLLAYWV